MDLIEKRRSRLLIVDDELKNIQLLGTLLKDEGYQINVAQDGESAIHTALEVKPDLILLDIMMPGLDGYEVCRKVKSDEKTKSIPVIFISALSEVNDIVKGFDAGGVDYVTKPFRQQEVLARIRTHLNLVDAMREVLLLRGILRICSECKKIRDDKGDWNQLEKYIHDHSDARCSHTICPDCAKEIYGDESWFGQVFNRM